MIKLKLILFIIVCSGYALHSQISNRLSLTLEGNFMPVSTAFQVKRISLNGIFSIDYNLTNRWYAGIYGGKMVDVSKKNTLLLIDDKIIDISSTEFINLGISLGYNILQEERFKIIPDIKLGYGIFKTKSPVSTILNPTEIKAEMITIFPKINAIYGLSDHLDFGLSGGYFTPIAYLSRSKIEEYNLQGINVGLLVKYNF